MGKNLVRTEMPADANWQAPNGVTQIRVLAFARLGSQVNQSSGKSAFGINMTGDAYAWGLNSEGQLGIGNVTAQSSPILVLGNQKWRMISSSGRTTTGITTNGDAYAWGNNGNGNLGIGNVTAQSSPILVLGSHKWRQVISNGGNAWGIDSAGAAWGWGDNTNGQIGDGTVVAKSSPIAVLGTVKFRQLFTTNNGVIGTDSLNNAYAWGLNDSGQLGLGDVVPRSSPVLVLGSKTWASLCFGSSQTQSNVCGITSAGDAYAWGNNVNGSLGVGDVIPRSSPVLVLGGLKWRRVSVSGASSGTMLGITTDGAGYAWGGNANGEVGDGTVVAKSSPVVILGGRTWRQINGTSGISTAGNMYAWGQNTSGGLGLGDVVPRSSPVLVLGSQTWRSIDDALVAEQIMDVIPGNVYAAGIFSSVVTFGPLAVYTDAASSGSMPVRLVLEYFT